MRDMDMLSNGGERERLILQICPALRVFDNEQKIDEINAENISNIIFSGEKYCEKKDW